MSDHGNEAYVPALRFRWLTHAYDVVVRATTRESTFKASLIEQANLGGCQRILDLACGTGTLAIQIKQRYPHPHVVGMDGDSEVLATGSRRATAVRATVQFDHGLCWLAEVAHVFC